MLGSALLTFILWILLIHEKLIKTLVENNVLWGCNSACGWPRRGREGTEWPSVAHPSEAHPIRGGRCPRVPSELPG